MSVGPRAVKGERYASQGGQVIALFALAVIPMLALVGMAVDGGNLFLQRRIAQNAADAAATAGTYALANNQGQAAIQSNITNYAAGNTGPLTSTTVLSSYYIDSNNANIATVSSGAPPANAVGVRVRTQRVFRTYLLQLATVKSLTVQAEAYAQGSTAVTPQPGLTMLNTGATSGTLCNGSANAPFYVNGGIVTMLSGGALNVPTSCNKSIDNNGGAVLNLFGTIGASCASPPCTVNRGLIWPLPGSLPSGSGSDPLASLAAPSAGPTQATPVTCTGATTLSPGVYVGGISVNDSNCELTLSPGIYIMKGGGLSVTRGATLIGNQAMIYNTGANYPTSPATGVGPITLSGTVSSWTPPSSGTYAGILIFQDRTSSAPMTISNSISLDGTGVIYGPQMPLTINSSITLAQLLVGSVAVNGSILAITNSPVLTGVSSGGIHLSG